MKLLHTFCCASLLTLLASCEIEEKAVPKPEPKAGVETNELAIGNDYKYQIFFDYETNKAVAKNEKVSWDLGFECTSDGYHIILNGSKSMFAYNTHETGFDALTDTTGKLGSKLWDGPSGSLDSTAIGDWRSKKEIYIIDRGYNETGEHQGFKKIQFLTNDATSYTLKMADINGAGLVQRTITKDDTYNFIFMSLADGQTVTVEPPKTTWDVVFTQYTHVFNEQGTLMPYLVTGCLLNRYNTTAYKDTVTAFAAITMQSTTEAPFSNAINTIGYDWKTYTGTTYIVSKNWNYVIKNRNGLYFKMHFISFFNTSGEKGSPSFEYQKL